MSANWFVTGTDTEVGKTAVSCALLTAVKQAGLTTAAVKPVAAGCDENGCNEDALQLMAAMTETLDYDQVNPLALADAVAPHIAAKREGRRMQASRIAGVCRGVMLTGADFVLIEGAGGWRVPINQRETLADVAVQLQTGVILVVGMRLGCINHALLTAAAIVAAGCTLIGWVANLLPLQSESAQEKISALESRISAPLLGVLPGFQRFSARAVAEKLWLPPPTNR